jgi:hypothetical protein
VTGVTVSPSSGLLTASASVGEGNTAKVTVKFSSPETISGTPTVTLSNGTVCPYATGSGTANIVFHCTVGSGQNTPVGLSASNPGMYGTYLATAATKTLQLNGGSIVDGDGIPAALTGADNVPFPGLAANTNPLYFLSPTGTDTGSGPGACAYASPCATLNFVKGLMEANSTKTVYLLGGTYNVESSCTANVVYYNYTYPSGSNGASAGNYPAIANAAVCLSSSADSGTSYLGYPGAFPELNGGATGNMSSGLAPGVANGVNIAFYLGYWADPGPGLTGVTVNGLKMYNFSNEAVNIEYVGDITITNNDIENIFSAPMYPTEAEDASAAIDGPEGTWHTIYVAHNVLSNIGGFGIIGGQDEGGSQGQQSGGSITKDSNIILNACLSTFDCGALYAFESTLTMTASWTNNILGGLNDVFSEQIYFDYATSNVKVSGNQVYGVSTASVLWHSGENDTVTNNFFDMSQQFSESPANNWPALSFYQGCSTGNCSWGAAGYDNDMPGNTLEHNIVWTSVAPFQPGCASPGLDCGYLWIWAQDPGQNIYNPTLSSNDYYATTGGFSGYGSSPSQSSGTYGPIGETSPMTTNPGASYTTGAAYGERHYTFTNPPSGWTALQTGQGPH